MDKGNIGHAFFLRKAFDMDELRKPYEKEFARGFKVEKVVELTEEQFQKFSSALSDYYRFLYDHRTDMYYDVGDMSYHCLLVTTPKYGDGILIEAEGYAYARYGKVWWVIAMNFCIWAAMKKRHINMFRNLWGRKRLIPIPMGKPKGALEAIRQIISNPAESY